MSDFDRPLNERGTRDAPVMAERLFNKNEGIQQIVSSTANRAITTAKVFAAKLGLGAESLIEQELLYGANTPTLLKIVNGLNDENDSVVIFGHNPGLTDFSCYLSGQYISNIPTCGIVKITFEVDSWKAVSRDLGTQVYFDFPKNTP